MTITIYHNPECGTSRNTLAMIRQSGEEPQVIEYLKTPPSREKLVELIAAMNATPRGLLREKGTPYAELGLGDAKWTDDELIDFMLEHPILINRPIVVTPLGTVLARPSEPCSTSSPTPISDLSPRKTARSSSTQKAGASSERPALISIFLEIPLTLHPIAVMLFP